MLSIKHVSKRFGGLHALRDVNVEAERSRVTAVIGPNGAGKSTLMNVISGFIAPDEGSVEVDGTQTLGLARAAFVVKNGSRNHGVDQAFAGHVGAGVRTGKGPLRVFQGSQGLGE